MPPHRSCRRLCSPLGTILQVAFTVKGGGATSLIDLQQLLLRCLSPGRPGGPWCGPGDEIYGGDEQQFQGARYDPQELPVQNVSLKQ